MCLVQCVAARVPVKCVTQRLTSITSATEPKQTISRSRSSQLIQCWPLCIGSCEKTASGPDMTSPKQVLKSVGPKLVPFFKTVAIYFVLFIPVERPSWAATLVKCLPIVCLIGFVLLHGISLGDEYTFSRRILTGLAFSCLGDALLVWPHYFLHGMAAFGVAQLMYTAAFGFKPLNVQLGAALYALCATAVVILMPGLSGVLMIGVPIYSILLVTMAWRAIARVQFFEELWTWTKLCSCAGGIVFAISDALIGFHHFHHPIPHSQALIMITYYAAQLGIALSVVDSKDSYDKTKTVNSSEPANTKIRIAIPQSSSSH